MMQSRNSWALAGFGVALGATWLVVALLGDQPGVGVFGLVVISALGAYMGLGRGEFSAISRGDDERQKNIDAEAMQFSYMAVVFVVLAGALTELARGDGPGAFTLVGSIGGFTYMGAIAFLKRRR